MTAKEIKIRESWIAEIGEEQFEVKVEGKLNSDGWLRLTEAPLLKYDNSNFNEGKVNYQDTNHWRNRRIRPKTLKNISDNNGWNRIDEVGLPKEEGEYVAGRLGDLPFVTYHQLDLEDVLILENQGRITHWRKVNFQPPIY